jgi:hypothetical protein
LSGVESGVPASTLARRERRKDHHKELSAIVASGVASLRQILRAADGQPHLHGVAGTPASESHAVDQPLHPDKAITLRYRAGSARIECRSAVEFDGEQEKDDAAPKRSPRGITTVWRNCKLQPDNFAFSRKPRIRTTAFLQRVNDLLVAPQRRGPHAVRAGTSRRWQRLRSSRLRRWGQ